MTCQARSRVAIFAALSLAAVGGCASPSHPPFPEDQRAAIADTIRLLGQGRMDAANRRDGAAIMTYYADDPELVWAEEGDIYTSRGWIAEEVVAHYARLREMHGTWDSMRVAVLSPNAAVLTATYRATSTNTTGETRSSRGARTLVFSRVDGVWRIIHTHESHLTPPTPSPANQDAR